MKRDELYAQAMLAVQSRRQHAASRAAQRLDALYQSEPRLRGLTGEANAAGAAAARLAAAGRGEEAREKQREARRLYAEKQKLLSALGAANAAPVWYCALCADTGRVNGRLCACVAGEMRRLRRNEINAASRLPRCRFDSFSISVYPEQMEEGAAVLRPRAHMEAVLRDCRDWAAEFGPCSQSLYLFGNAGLGKTHLALSIASEVLDKGFDVIYVSAQSAFSAVAGDWEDSAGLFESMLEADLLVLDDLGTEFLTAYTAGKLYELVNRRMGRRPTIYTTNICQKQVLDARYDEKITSRLLGECHLVRFWGEDLRLRKQRGG